MTRLWDLDVTEMAGSVRRGDTTAEALAATCLERLSVLGARLNAVAGIDREASLEAARAIDLRRAKGEALGPLAGVPLAHKDMFFRAGRICGRGLGRGNGIVPTATAPLLARLDAAGALDIARLHMAEIAMSPTGRNFHDGPARNPWNTDHAPGGSSSGSAAAVAARLVPASLGSDTGGSIRHPAAMCGLLGLKPTQGLLSLDGALPLAPSLDCPGILARSARDIALILAVIQPRDPADLHLSPANDLAGLTVAVPDGAYRSQGGPGVIEAVDASIPVLKEAGASILRTDSPDIARLNELARRILAFEAAMVHRLALMSRPEDYSGEIRARLEPGLAMSPQDYAEALRMRSAILADWLETAMRDADLVHIPTLPVTAPSLEEAGRMAGGTAPAINARITANTMGINYLGLPALAVPCGFVDLLPVSFQLVGRAHREDLLLRVAHAYQLRQPWPAAPVFGRDAPARDAEAGMRERCHSR